MGRGRGDAQSHPEDARVLRRARGSSTAMESTATPGRRRKRILRFPTMESVPGCVTLRDGIGRRGAVYRGLRFARGGRERRRCGGGCDLGFGWFAALYRERKRGEREGKRISGRGRKLPGFVLSSLGSHRGERVEGERARRLRAVATESELEDDREHFATRPLAIFFSFIPLPFLI